MTDRAKAKFKRRIYETWCGDCDDTWTSRAPWAAKCGMCGSANLRWKVADLRPVRPLTRREKGGK